MAIVASILIKTSHINYWEYYSIHVNSRMLYPLVTRATTVATERSICVKWMKYPHVETNYALMAVPAYVQKIYQVLFFQCILSVHVNSSDNSYSGL